MVNTFILHYCRNRVCENDFWCIHGERYWFQISRCCMSWWLLRTFPLLVSMSWIKISHTPTLPHHTTHRQTAVLALAPPYNADPFSHPASPRRATRLTPRDSTTTPHHHLTKHTTKPHTPRLAIRASSHRTTTTAPHRITHVALRYSRLATPYRYTASTAQLNHTTEPHRVTPRRASFHRFLPPHRRNLNHTA